MPKAKASRSSTTSANYSKQYGAWHRRFGMANLMTLDVVQDGVIDATVPLKRVVVARVKRGALVLRKRFGKDWTKHVSVVGLHMYSGDRCVLGQMYSDARLLNNES